jgi:hypothetical protein
MKKVSNILFYLEYLFRVTKEIKKKIINSGL